MPILPLKSDRRLQNTPWVNYALIAANTIVFLITYRHQLFDPEIIGRYYLRPEAPRLHQFITYQFLHGDAWHLLGNMFFLYVFGNHVEDRLGKIGYLAFYLAAGILAGYGHALFEKAPVLGASGAVCGVTGAYLALFPLSNITLLYWFGIFGTFEVSSLVIILVQIIQNILFEVMGSGGVAYLAHLAGYLFGFVVGMGLLWSRLVPREPFDLLALLEQRRRRAKFAALTREGYQPWVGRAPHGAGESKPGDAAAEQTMRQRAKISAELAAGRPEAAAELYVELIERDASQVMSGRQQVDIANQLMAMSKHDAAARAYELYLNTFRTDPNREQIELILGLLYFRYLNRRQRARELLHAALPRLTDAEQKSLAQQMLAEIAA